MMINFAWNLEVDIFVVTVVLYVMYMTLKYNSNHTRDRAFLSIGVCSILIAISDALWAAMTNGILHWPIMIGYCINILYLMAVAMTGFYWFVYSEMTMEIPWTRSNRMILLFALPELALLILLVISIWTGTIFTIDSDMVYHRGPLLFVATIVDVVYPTFTSMRGLIRSFKKKYYIYHALYRSLTGFLLFPAIGTILLFIDPNAPYLASGISLAYIFVFFLVQDSCVQNDELTDMPNKRRLYPYLDEIIKQHNVFSRKDLYYIMIDVANMNKILRQHGSFEVDNVAIHMSQIVKTVAKEYKCFASRYSVEEFSIVFETEEPNDINLLINRVNELIEGIEDIPYQINIIYSYARYDKVSMDCARNLVDLTEERLKEKQESMLK